MKIFVFLLSLFLLLPLNSSAKDSSLPYKYKDYNLIIIGFDALRARNLGCFGYQRNTSPNIDEFSKGAFVFKNAVSASSWTLPSFMSFFTSLYPYRHKLLNKYSKLTDTEQVLSSMPDNIYTLAQVLKENGYVTAGFTGDAGVTGSFGYSRGFDTYYDKITFAGFDTTYPLALNWLNENKDKKIFLFVHGYDTHGKYNLEKDPKSKKHLELRNATLDKKLLNLTQADIESWLAWYDEKISATDQRFGRFLRELNNLGLGEKTIIVVICDHGDEYYEHGGFDHGLTLYDELIHIPLIIKAPQQKGKIIKEQIRSIDLMPTLLELMGIYPSKDVKEQMQGASLIPLLQGKTLKLDAFSETDYLLQTFKRSLRKHNGWKFIYDLETQTRELYNLNTDPQETKNLINSEPAIAHELEQELFSKYLGY